MLRKTIERLSRGIAIKRKLPADFKSLPLYVSPDCALKFWRSGLSGELIDLVRIAKCFVREGDNVWDIGANVGVFTFAAAAMSGPNGKLLAVEADAWLAVLLQRSRMLQPNLGYSIDVLCTAVSDEDSILTFQIAERGRMANSLEKSGQREPAGGVRYSQPVPSYTLDSLLDHFAHPKILKIDVEGAELLVLRGSTRLLDVVRPIIYIEVGESVSENVFALLKSHQYEIFDGDVLDFTPKENAPWATLAIPNEQVSQWVSTSVEALETKTSG
jgi:FkbM family methyltransferase